jgi:acetylornithine deacetylase/succinyl-diaminopimelate desuccinylase-like protein
MMAQSKPPDEKLRTLSHVADALMPQQLDLFKSLVQQQTVSSTTPDEGFKAAAAKTLDMVGAEVASLGFVPQQWTAGGEFPVLAAELLKDDASPVIGFNGHVDVVPVEDPAKWRHDPWAGDSDGLRLFGRGASDAKGAVVAMLGALRLLQEASLKPATSLLLHIVSDEEVAGPCTDECLDRAQPDAVVIGEPSFLDVWIAEPGLEHVRIEIDGIGTHALNRWKALPDTAGTEVGGVNAIEKALVVVEAVRELERRWTTQDSYTLLPQGFNTINLGTMLGGKSVDAHSINSELGPGSVPDLCILEYNIWYYPHQPLSDLRDAFEEGILRACEQDWWLASHPPRFTWALRGLTNPPAETSPDHALSSALAAAARHLRPDASVTAMQGASLLPWYTRRGIPGVIFGPGHVAKAHSTDEYIEIASLRDAIIALALVLTDEELKEVPRLPQ